MPTTERTVRVFISSTFRDMQAERDHLVKFVFPQLRKLCESRGVTWGEVDLRWGVTDEEAAEGKVLPLCLEEIKRCRPYFLGLLGERYGWIPETLSAELLEREPWLQEHVHGRKSVTELEILQGVLNDPQMAERAFFYFRDPAYAASVPAERIRDFAAEDPPSAMKLRALKDRIRQSHRDGALQYPPRESYSDPPALGELVLQDLARVIEEIYPADEKLDPLDREAADHGAYAQSRARVYIGRPEYFRRLDAHAAGSGDQPLVVLGESGSGKSALLSNWVLGSADHIRKESPAPRASLWQKLTGRSKSSAEPPQVSLFLIHFIGASPYSADWSAMLRRILGEFKRRLGIEQDIPDSPEALRRAFPNWLHMAGAKGRVVLVLDALNQLEDRDGAPDLVWLPPVMPENVRLIVSTLPGRPLDEIRKRGWPTLEVEPLTPDERRELIGQYLAQHAKSLSPARAERIGAAPQSANPLYLRVLLDELRVFGIYERLEERIGDYLQAQSPYELYGKVIARWQQDYGGDTDLVGDTLSLLWAARRGLSEAELLDELGRDGQLLPRATWSPLFLAMSDALVSRGGLLTFAHEFLRRAARDAYVSSESEEQRAHLRLADYFERQLAGPRRTDELPWQLAAARAWDRLQALLVDRVFLAEAWSPNPFDVKSYWVQIEAASPLRMVEAYRPQIEHPESESDKGHLWCLGLLLGDSGHPQEALALRSALVDHFRAAGDWNKLQVSLGGQANILSVRGDLDGAMALCKEQERICRQLGDLDGLSASLGNQAVILQTRGDLDGAMTLHQEEERICRQLGNLDGLRASLNNHAVILKVRGDLDGAMALYKEGERICQQLGNLDGLQGSLGNQANILSARGDLDGAMRLYNEQERICQQLGNLVGLQLSLGNQAAVLQTRGDLDRAMTLHKEEERICRQLENLDGLSTTLANQATILSVRGDLDGAMALYKQQERICRQLGNLDGLQASLSGQAVILKARGDLDGAMALNKEAEQICRQLGNLHGLSGSLSNQALILSARGDLDGAMVLHKEQERICRHLGNLHGLSASLNNQANILDAHGDLDRAMALHKETERICRHLGNLDGLRMSLGNQGLVLQARRDLAGAMVLHKEEERICRHLGNLDGLSASLGNQAVILQARGDLNGAMALYKEQERFCRQLGLIEVLSYSLINQAMVLQTMGRAGEGLPLAQEAYSLAATHGYAALAKQIEPVLKAVRQASNS